MDIVKIVASLISEDPDGVGRYFAAVACVERRGQWLLGLSTASDDRKGKWIFPGGGIKDGERPEAAAVRECREETGVVCRANGAAFDMPGKPGIAFVHCRVSGTPVVKMNHEFRAMGFFSKHEMKRLRLYHNVLEIVNRC